MRNKTAFKTLRLKFPLFLATLLFFSLTFIPFPWVSQVNAAFSVDPSDITGLCRIISKSNPDKAIKASANTEGAAVITDYLSDVIQEWDIQSTGDGYYKLTNQWSGKALTCSGTANGSAVTVAAYTGADSQKFTLEMVDDKGYFYLTRKGTSKTIIKADATTTNNQVVLGDKSSTGRTTQWVITKTIAPPSLYYSSWGVYTPITPGNITIKGYLGRTLDRCLYGRLWDTSISALVNPFISRNEGAGEWKGEFWGKWYTSLLPAYKYAPTTVLKKKIETAVTDLKNTQTGDGYIGCESYGNQCLYGQGWDVWERKYVHLGLLGYYDISGDSTVLNASKNAQNYLQTQVGSGLRDLVRIGCWNGAASSSILEPVMQLYKRSNTQAYLDFANYIINQVETIQPQFVSKALSHTAPKVIDTKSYESMSFYEGLIELYNHTGNADYKNAAIYYYDGIQEHEMTIIGASGGLDSWGEQWDYMKEKQGYYSGAVNETCVTATIFKFCKQLYRMTGDPKYMDQMEKTLYNALFAEIKSDGSWFTHVLPLNGSRTAAGTQCGMPLDCCVACAPRALFLAPELAVMKDANGPVVNLYSEGSATVPLGANSIRIDTTTGYPKTDTITMKIYPNSAQSFTLKLRIPAWSDVSNTTLTVNGSAQSFTPGTYAAISRTWNSGDTIVLKLDLRGKYNSYTASNGSVYQAVTRGPLALARDVRFSDGDINVSQNITQTGGIVTLTEITPPSSDIWMAFTVSTDSGQINMCDFASAGNDWSSSYRTWFERTTPAQPGWNKVNDSASAGTHNAGVSQASGLSGYYNSDAHFSKTAGDYFQFTFSGTGIRWYGKKDVDHGKADVYLDGTLDQTVDGYASSAQLQSICYEKTGLINGSHTLKIVVRSDKNGSATDYFSDWDAFEFYVPGSTTAPTATPTPTPTATFTPTPTPTPAAGWTRVNDTDGAATYSNCSYTTTATGYYNNDAHYSKIAGSYAQYTFTGTGIRWIGKKDTDHGKADVYLDGALDQTVDTYASSAQIQSICYEKTGLASGSHTLKVVVRSDKNGSATDYFSDWDAFEYTAGTGPTATPTPTPTPTATPTPTPASTPVTTKVNDDGAGVTYGGGTWTDNNNVSGYYNNDAHYTILQGLYAQFTFTGTTIKWIGGKNTDHGKAEVYIDGALDATVDTYASSWLLQQTLYTKTGLASGSHTIKIVVTNTKNASASGYCQDVDAFEYTN